ncbi:reverse transcriptase, partial [Globisporangium splendens]
MRLYWPRFETRDRADSIGSNASTVSSSQGSLGSDAGFLLDSDEDSDVEDDLDNDEDHHHHHAHEDPPPPPPPQTRATVTEVHPHRGPHYVCTLCGFSAPHMFVLGRHRALAHENDHFVDIFTCECACDRHFTTRGAAANHERGCSTAQNTTTLGLAPQNDGPDPETAAPSSIPEPGPPPTTMSPPATVPERTSTCTSTVGYQTEGAKRRRLAPPLPDDERQQGASVPPSQTTVFLTDLLTLTRYRVHQDNDAAHPVPPPATTTTTTNTQVSIVNSNEMVINYDYAPTATAFGPQTENPIYENENPSTYEDDDAWAESTDSARAQIDIPPAQTSFFDEENSSLDAAIAVSGPGTAVTANLRPGTPRTTAATCEMTQDPAPMTGLSAEPAHLTQFGPGAPTNPAPATSPSTESALLTRFGANATRDQASGASPGPVSAIAGGTGANARPEPTESALPRARPPRANLTTARNSSLGPRNAISVGESANARTITAPSSSLSHENAPPVPENALARPTTARNSSLGPRNAISVGESANARTTTAPSSSLSHENAPPVPENALARPTTARNSSLGPRNAISVGESANARTTTAPSSSLSHENAPPVPENALARPTTALNSSLGPRNAISVGESANARTTTAPSSGLSHENAPPVPENALARPTTARNSSLGPRNAILEAASTAMRTRTQGERTLTANPLNWRSDTVPAARPDRNERVLTARPSRWRSATTPTTPITTEAINETPATTTTTQAITPEAPDDGRPWLLRFDGACPGNPGKGGAGSALYEPGGAILWTCHHFLPENFNTNNTAEYTALLDGVQAAKRHGARRLRVEGDSILVIRQVRGIYACGNKRLRALRNRILGCLRSLDSFELHHIDRKANTQADALANRALDHAATKSVCAVHGAGDDRCWTPIQRKTTSQRPDPEATVDEEMKETSDDDEEVVRRDEGEVYAPVRLEPGTIPAKRPRLQLRALSENEDEKSRAIIERFAKKMATKITDCEDWETGEGYITALTMQMYDLLQEYSTTKKPRSMMKTKKKTTATKTMMRPPRPSTQHREARLEEALDDLIIAQRAEPSQQGRIQKARRRVGRVKAAILRSKLRLKFEQKEKECVQELLRGVNEDVTEGPMEDTTCPIGREDLYAFFQGVNTPNMVFDFDSDVGAPFRAVLQRLPPPEQVREALTDDLTIDEIEDQLQIVNGASSPGLDGIGHDVYKHFRLQLLPALHAAFSFCWKHKKVPTAWKVGTVRLLYKKGDPNQPSNWRPICLQQCIYKLYSGILAKRFTRWMDTNERFSLAQKGFRAFNGCHEHNFLSTSLLDQTRRMHRKLYNVWYDLKNAFGSLPQELMWRVLGMLRVDAAFIERAQNIYEDSHFVVNNAHDGPTDPIRQEIGVYQGCPLSPYLFIAALIPLLRGLQELPGVGVPLAENFRPCVSAYADDIKIFSDSASGIRSAHQLVERFLKWTTMRANPSKCALLAVTTNSRGNPELDTELQLHLDGTPIPRLTLSDSYAYLGIGDGFDHIQRRFALVPKLGELKKNVVALLRSPLAPWQILKAVKTYIYPQVEYALRHLRPLHSQLQGFDRVLSKGLRHLLRLPSSATTAFMYAPTSHGGLGLLPLTELHAALQIAHGWQMLHSKDHTIQAVARTQITQIIRKRYRLDEEYWKERTEEAIQRFLNSDLDPSLTNIRKRRNGDIGSLWTDIQRHLATHQLRLADVVDPSSGERQWLQLKTPSSRDWLEHTTVLRQVKLHMKNAHLNRWKEMSDQGRTVRAQGGPGSSFLTRGTGMWDNDYVFAVQARLNQLDTRSVLKRKRVRTNATCRYAECRSTETLAHVLNHCPGTSDAVTKRHDSALKLITDTLQPRVLRSQERLQLRVNETVEGMAGQLRPDLQLFDTRSKTVVVADLAITYEDHQQDGPEFSSLAASAQRKIEKYQPIKVHLMQQGWTVHLSALVYGSLGSVLPGNFKVYTEELGLLKKDARRLNTTISTEAIKASRRIWNLHCALHRGPTRRVETQTTTHPDPVQIQTPDRRLQASPAQLQHDPAPERRPQPTDTRAPAPEQRERRVRITAPAPEQQQGDRPATNSAPDERQRHQTLHHRHPAPPGRQPELQHRLPPVRNQPNQPRHRRPTLRGGAPVHRAPATETTRPTPELQRGQPSGTGTQVRRSTLSTSIAGTAAGPRSAPAPTRGGTDGEARRPTPPARAGRSTSDPTATRRPRSAFSATAGAPATRQPRRAYSATAGTPATRPARRAFSATAGTPATRPARRTFSATAGTPATRPARRAYSVTAGTPATRPARRAYSATAGTPEAPTRGPGGPTGTNQSV